MRNATRNSRSTQTPAPLEEQRLELERQRLAIENRFANRHLGLLLTTVISVATVVLSAAQIWVASIQRKTEVDRASIQKEEEITLARLEQDRRWRLDVATFVFDRRATLFSITDADLAVTKDILLVTFPPEITGPLFRRLGATAATAQQQQWTEAAQVADGLASLPVSDPRSRRVLLGLRPEAAALATTLIQEARTAGFDVRLLSGLRTIEEQEALFARGRSAPGPIVTRARRSTHNTGLAFDIAIFRDGKWVFTGSDYNRIGAIGRQLGLIWGGDSPGMKDAPHFEHSTAKAEVAKLQSNSSSPSR